MTIGWRVTTWNLHGSAAPPIDRVAGIVDELDVDVLVLQEIRRAQARQLARRLGWQHTWHPKHHPYTPLVWWRTEGMAVLSPHRLHDPRMQSLTPGTSTWTYRHRIAVVATVERGAGERLHVLDLHLASDADGTADRLTEARRARCLVDVMASPSIVAGDLNDHGDAAVIDVLGGGSHVDAWPVAVSRSAGDGSTNPSHAPTQRLDHVLVPHAAVDVHSVVPEGGSEWAELSDHLPLTVSFTLPA